jgi:hypothetical protein
MLLISERSASKLYRLPNNSFPALQYLHVICVYSRTPPLMSETPFCVFSSACNLRSVISNSPWQRLHPCYFHMPWARLTVLSLPWSPVEAEAIFTVLSNCASLEELHILVRRFPGPTSDVFNTSSFSNHPLCLENLQFLSLYFDDSCDDPIVSLACLHMLELPNLCGLSLDGVSGNWLSSPNYISFLVSISSTLKSFTTSVSTDRPRSFTIPYPEHDMHIENILTCIPHVQKVRLSKILPLLPSTLQKIAAGTLLPNVEDITFASTDPGSVLEMLTIRQTAASGTPVVGAQPLNIVPLKRVGVRCPVPIPAEVLSDFQSEELEICQWSDDEEID